MTGASVLEAAAIRAAWQACLDFHRRALAEGGVARATLPEKVVVAAPGAPGPGRGAARGTRPAAARKSVARETGEPSAWDLLAAERAAQAAEKAGEAPDSADAAETDRVSEAGDGSRDEAADGAAGTVGFDEAGKSDRAGVCDGADAAPGGAEGGGGEDDDEAHGDGDAASSPVPPPYPFERLGPLDSLPSFPPAAFEALEACGQRTLEANLRLNLVSRRDPARQILDNILDALILALALPDVARETFSDAKSTFLLDAGSGSGVPGVPAWLALEAAGVNPFSALLLVESREGKALFIERLVEALGIEAATVHQRRLEAPELPGLIENTGLERGILTARAMGGTDRCLRWSRRLRKRLGAQVFVKGAPGLAREWQEEGKRWPSRGWIEPAVRRFERPEYPVELLRLLPA